MDDSMKMKHHSLQAYVDQYKDAAAREKIGRSIAVDAGGKLFLEIIGSLLDKVCPEKIVNVPPQKISFSEADDLLLKLTSASIAIDEAQQLINNLYHSPLFFQRFFIKLNQVGIALEAEHVPELDFVKIKSEDEILAGMPVFNHKTVKGKYTFVPKLAKAAKRLTDKIKELFFPGENLIPKLAAAFSLLLIVFCATYFGIVYYNISYKLYLAQDLLQDNYRVYIDKEPRLSGGYATTGIGELMSGEEETEAYLEKAAALSQQALSYDSGSASAKQMLAKIFYIQQDYTRSDSLLNLISAKDREPSAALLNDLGVLSMKQRRWQKAGAYFKSSIEQEPAFKEAYYNLALYYIETNSIREAQRVLNMYISLENDTAWQNAARKLFQQL